MNKLFFLCCFYPLNVLSSDAQSIQNLTQQLKDLHHQLKVTNEQIESLGQQIAATQAVQEQLPLLQQRGTLLTQAQSLVNQINQIAHPNILTPIIQSFVQSSDASEQDIAVLGQLNAALSEDVS